MINTSTRASFLYNFISRAYGLLINMLASFSAVIIINLIINIDRFINNSENIGKLFVYSISMSDQLQWGMRQLINLEVCISSV